MAQQKTNAANLAVTVILAALGVFYLLASHDMHVSSGIGFGLDHSVHVILGAVLLAAGAAYYAKQTGALK